MHEQGYSLASRPDQCQACANTDGATAHSVRRLNKVLEFRAARGYPSGWLHIMHANLSLQLESVRPAPAVLVRSWLQRVLAVLACLVFGVLFRFAVKMIVRCPPLLCR